MKLKFKNNFLGYFNFYYSILGNKLVFNLLFCVVISFIDGMGLAMFMPLLQVVGGSNSDTGEQTMGYMHYLVDAVEGLGFSLTLTTVMVTIVSLFLFKGFLKYLQLSYQVRLRHSFMSKVRHGMVNDLHNLSYEGFLRMDAGKIQNTLVSEVQRLFQSMNSYFNAAQSAVMLSTYIALAFLANYQFALLVTVGAGLTNLIYQKIYRAVKNASKELSKKGSNFNGFLIQAIHNFKYLKATNYFDKFSRKLYRVIDETELLNRKISSYNAITTSMREPMIIVVVMAVIYSQITWMGSSLASILLSLLLFYRSLNFLMIVQNHWQAFMQNIGALLAVSEFTAEMASLRESNPKNEFPGFHSHIEFDKVVFSYGDKKVLDHITLTIPKNQTIALVGESGSGKTTLANMISGLINPQEGSVLLDKTALKDLSMNSYREKIGYISQEPVIFNDNIYNNVTFWAEPTAQNQERFWQVVELASLNEFVKGQRHQEKTELGDNGLLISGGQKQRISIARELFKQAEILILDEATSSLDSETEKSIQENLEKLHGNYTMVIIAHRLSTIKNADRIYLLEKGKVTASGDFKNMLEASVRFKRMVELQEF
jgi:subfamily B ATP-binding cassette protein MsbA